MHTIDNIKFGEFLMQLRKEKGYTQKDVAEKLGVSDKAVSKWERGLSFPDITLLDSLATVLGVSLTELYHSERIDEGAQLGKDQVDLIIESSIQAANNEFSQQKRYQMIRTRSFLASIVAMILIVSWMNINNYLPSFGNLNSVGGIELAAVVILTYFTFFVKTKLPVYYDQNNINVYTHGVVRLHIAGLKLNNNNWQPIVHANCICLSILIVILPIIYTIYSMFTPFSYQTMVSIAVALLFGLMFLPTYIVGKKYA
ncbi:MAG: helix-turn-helix transcriptional regulator [Anaerorhabdus sp.]